MWERPKRPPTERGGSFNSRIRPNPIHPALAADPSPNGYTLSSIPRISVSQESTMATSDNPFVVPNMVTGADEPADHQHDVPIVNIEEKDRETLEYEPPEVVAEEEKAILEFDEADALFGKRSEVKDSHDRY
jgi:hypothetical protein